MQGIPSGMHVVRAAARQSYCSIGVLHVSDGYRAKLVPDAAWHVAALCKWVQSHDSQNYRLHDCMANDCMAPQITVSYLPLSLVHDTKAPSPQHPALFNGRPGNQVATQGLLLHGHV